MGQGLVHGVVQDLIGVGDVLGIRGVARFVRKDPSARQLNDAIGILVGVDRVVGDDHDQAVAG